MEVMGARLVDEILRFMEENTVGPDPRVVDRKGQPVTVGDRVSFGTYPRGTAEGTVIVSERQLACYPDGQTFKALSIRTDDGTVYAMPGSKKLLKLK